MTEDKKEEIQEGIIRRETKKGVNGMVLEEKYLQVYGKDLSECKKISDEVWDK